jgi:hypothetical protein
MTLGRIEECVLDRIADGAALTLALEHDASLSDVREQTIQRARHLIRLERVDEETRIPDLPAAAAAHETPQLLVGAPPFPRCLLLERAKGAQVTLNLEDPFDCVDPERTDQLVLEVRVADEEVPG